MAEKREVTKIYTADEIRRLFQTYKGEPGDFNLKAEIKKIAPNFKGKPEKFDPTYHSQN